MELKATIDTQIIDNMVELHGYAPEDAIEEALNMLKHKFLEDYDEQKERESKIRLLQDMLKDWYDHDDSIPLLNFIYDNEEFMYNEGFKVLNAFMKALI